MITVQTVRCTSLHDIGTNKVTVDDKMDELGNKIEEVESNVLNEIDTVQEHANSHFILLEVGMEESVGDWIGSNAYGNLSGRMWRKRQRGDGEKNCRRRKKCRG